MIELTGHVDKHEYTNKHGVKSVVYLMDCMDAMAQMGDKEFSLLCSDPPYGINRDGAAKTTSKHEGRKAHAFKGWDNKPPSSEYFKQVFRITENQIIWGANYFTKNLPASMGWIFWDKGQRICNSDGELAFTSFERALRVVEYNRVELLKEGTIHVTQKPIVLYDWIFHNYAKPNDTIFDSHLGSGSSRIAADRHNLPFTGIELDADYFYAHCKRFDNHTAQQTLF